MAAEEADTELIKRIARKDKAALKAFYDRHYDGLVRFISAQSKDPVEAADIAQDAMLAVWQTADRFAGRSAVKSWLYSIARNKAIDRGRKLARMELTADEQDQADDAPDAAAVIAAAQDAAQVQACIEKLSDSHRRVIHLAFFDELPYAEIGEVEGAAVGTIKTRIHHAKKLLMHCLSGAWLSR